MSVNSLKERATVDLISNLQKQLANLDPVAFAENYLTIDGNSFNMSNGTGYKYLAEAMRHVAAQAENKRAKPTVILKGRQVGATVMAAILSLYFTSSGLYGTGMGGRPPMRILHLFPTIPIMSKYTKDKLEPMMRHSTDNHVDKMSLKSAGVSHAADDTLTEKTFRGDNKIRIDAIGKDADRIRGLTQDAILFDECLPYEQCIETEDGKMMIGVMCKKWKRGEALPLVKTFNESTEKFEYKRITNAWNRGKRQLSQITCGNREVRCTDNHLFLTDNGWKPAGELAEGDLLKVSPGTAQYLRALNEDQYQLMLGSFLGDGELSSHKRGRYRVSVTHGIDQDEYCTWKASMFNVDTKIIKKNGYSQKPAITFCTKSFGINREFPKNKSYCPQWVLDELDARGLAIWFMDDGSVQSKNHQGARISTCSFDEDSQKRIVEKLQSFGIDCKYKLYSGYYYIMISKRGYVKLSETISPYVHDQLRYKIDPSIISNSYEWDSSEFDYAFTCVDRVRHNVKEAVVYDIEVEDNHNFIATSGLGSSNLGGITLHNCQDMQESAVENALRILTAAQYGKPTQGVQMFFGTPKESGSKFWKIWQDSDQRFFQPKCSGCKEHFFIYEYGKDTWKDVWVEGFTLKCPHCGTHQDKRLAIDAGKWTATRNSETARYTGFHINIILDPRFTKEMVEDYDPNVNPNRSERAWRNETLGEFFSSGGLPLTMEDIVHNALDLSRGVSRGTKDESNKVYTLGIDWGDKSLGSDEDNARGQSYTAMCVLSCDHKGVFTVENAFRLRKNNPAHRIRVVEELYERYKIKNGAADYYHGRDIVEHFQVDMNWKSKLLACHNSGTLGKMLSFDPKQTKVVLNKDLMVEEIFNLVRSGKLKFPVKGTSWDHLLWLMQHCTSMESKMIMRSDNYVKRYVKGSGPNDGLMSILYALVAYKFIATGGFTTRNALIPKSTFPMPLLAHAPGIKG